MNENTGNSGNDFFYDLLDNPADLSHSNAFNLQQLINEFPQSGLLRSMLAVKRDEESLQSASAYVNPNLLYIIANSASSLRAVSNEQIAVCQAPGEAKAVLPLTGGLELPNLIIDESNYFHVSIDRGLAYIEDEKAEGMVVPEEDRVNDDADQEIESDEVATATIHQDTENDIDVAGENKTERDPASSVEIDTEVEEEKETGEHLASISKNNTEVAGENETEEADATQYLEIDTEVANEEEAQTDPAPLEIEVEPAGENQVEADFEATVDQVDNAVVEKEDNKKDTKPIEPHQEIDDEVFEEIVSIEDIGLEQLALMDKGTDTDEAEQNVANNPQETPAGDSYFVFEPTLPEDEEYHAPANIAIQNAPGSKDRQHVSRYNDEKMPYSFMWWLDKTRKEHASIYQPFAAEGKFHTETVTVVEKPQPAADHLQQQYVENIFAVSSVVSDLNVIPPKADAPAMETKADKIIEKFIHEEPQIKHPSKVKLDSENKAKKSSEDRDELVTETLAKIYTEQMLYHKAILTYKKLMLKFPEKSLYFAGQIEQLENKIN